MSWTADERMDWYCKTYVFRCDEQVDFSEYVFDIICGEGNDKRCAKYPTIYVDPCVKFKYIQYIIVEDNSSKSLNKNRCIMGIMQFEKRRTLYGVTKIFKDMGLFTHHFYGVSKPLITPFLEIYLIRQAENICTVKNREKGRFNLGCGKCELDEKIDEYVARLCLGSERVMPTLNCTLDSDVFMKLVLFKTDYFSNDMRNFNLQSYVF